MPSYITILGLIGFFNGGAAYTWYIKVGPSMARRWSTTVYKNKKTNVC